MVPKSGKKWLAQLLAVEPGVVIELVIKLSIRCYVKLKKVPKKILFVT